MLYEANMNFKSFRSISELAIGNQGPIPQHIVIHADKRPISESVRRYNDSARAVVDAIVRGTEYA